MIVFNFMLLLICFEICYCVPPIAAVTTTERPDHSVNFSGELKQIKFAMKTLTEHFEKWNYLYLIQLEPKITSSATTLASIDSNIRNLQERAYVWDTFQLHVAAWNEQLSTSDRKLDIISKAQEEMMVLEGKINSFSNVEYKMDEMLKKLEDFKENLSNLNKKLENSGQLRDGLFGEFATRGILSTLKLIERKLDKIQLANQNLKANQSVRKNADDAKGKLTIKCNTPLVVEELLHDVASKVDVIFDRVSVIDNNVEELEQNDYLEDQNYSGEEVDYRKADADAKLINKLWKKVNQPWKHATKLLKQLIRQVQVVNNNTIAILNDELICLESYKTCWSTDFKPFINNLFKTTIEKISSNLNLSTEKQTHALENHLTEQKKCLNEILKMHLKDEYMKIDKNRANCIQEPNSVLLVPTESHNSKFSNSFSCDDIQFGEATGVYYLGNQTGVNDFDAFYFTRYCDIREDGSWTVIQNRDNYKTLQNFSLDWYNYKMGFGQLYADFWFGNEFIHKLSHEEDLILRVELEDFEENTAWAEYDQFQIASESENYRITIGDYCGNASDSFSSHNNSLFSTFDVKNDEAPNCCPCAESYGGGWWFNSCFESNLNGVYHQSPHSNDYFRGIIWEHWLGNYSLKKTRMLVRKKKANNEDQTRATKNNHTFLDDP